VDNLVGDNLPSADKLKALLKKVTEVRQELARFCIVLPPDARKRRLRMRRNALQFFPLLTDLVTKYKVETPAAPLAAMNNDARLAGELSPIEDQVSGLQQLVEDTLMEAEHEAWQAFLMYYGVLQNVAQRTPELAAEMRPLEELLASPRRARRDEPARPAPATP